MYAVDLSDELVELLRGAGPGVPTQLRPIQNSLTSIRLPSGVADVVLLANVLHDIPVSTLSEAVQARQNAKAAS